MSNPTFPGKKSKMLSAEMFIRHTKHEAVHKADSATSKHYVTCKSPNQTVKTDKLV